MMMKIKVLACACGVFAVGAWAPAQVKVEFKPTQVVANSITPGGDAVFFAVARERVELGVSVRRWSRVAADDDRDGQVVLDLGGSVPIASVWAVLDLATGQCSIVSPPDYPYGGSNPFPGGALQRGGGGRVIGLQLAAESLDILVVRPGVGAWRRGANDARPGRTPAGLLAVPVERLQPLGAAPEGPGPLATGDILIGVDPLFLRPFLERVGFE